MTILEFFGDKILLVVDSNVDLLLVKLCNSLASKTVSTLTAHQQCYGTYYHE